MRPFVPAVFLLLLVVAACVSSPTPTPAPVPTSTPIPAIDITCGGPGGLCERLAREAVTVVLGRVVSLAEEGQSAHPEERDDFVIYQDWNVEVERYLRNELPFQRIQVRVFVSQLPRSAAYLPSPALPLRTPRLAQGERVVLFLSKSDPWNTVLKGNEFTIAGPFVVPVRGAPGSGFVFGKLGIEEEQTRLWVFPPLEDPPPPEPLDEVLAAIEALGR